MMSNLEVRHLRLVHYVALEGSLTKAMRHLYLTQPALSHQLKDLEEKLGTPVFLRVGKAMHLTPAGRRLLKTARQVLTLLDETEKDVQRLAAGQLGTIRISTECYTCYHWLPRIIGRFQAAYPEVSIDINAAATHQPLSALLDGEIDLAIVSNEVSNPKVQTISLFEDEKVALMLPDHPLADRPFLEAKDFADQHLIVYNGETSSVVKQFLYPEGVHPRRLTEVQVTEGILELVKSGLGISVLAQWAALPDLTAGRLVGVPVTPKGWLRQWRAALINDDGLPDYLYHFVEQLSQNPLTGLDTNCTLRAG